MKHYKIKFIIETYGEQTVYTDNKFGAKRELRKSYYVATKDAKRKTVLKIKSVKEVKKPRCKIDKS